MKSNFLKLLFWNEEDTLTGNVGQKWRGKKEKTDQTTRSNQNLSQELGRDSIREICSLSRREDASGRVTHRKRGRPPTRVIKLTVCTAECAHQWDGVSWGFWKECPCPTLTPSVAVSAPTRSLRKTLERWHLESASSEKKKSHSRLTAKNLQTQTSPRPDITTPRRFQAVQSVRKRPESSSKP